MMRSGWFWNTDMWLAYQHEYAKVRPECLHEWKSSPLADDHDFSDCAHVDGVGYQRTFHQTQVIDLKAHKWSDVRKSYRGLINQSKRDYGIDECGSEAWRFTAYMGVHIQANGVVRPFNTYQHQYEWLQSGHGLLVGMHDYQHYSVFAYWILYQNCAYYMSGPKTYDYSQHAVIWKSLEVLKEKGIRFVEMGQVDGETEKEKSVGFFKSGFGGYQQEFIIVRRVP